MKKCAALYFCLFTFCLVFSANAQNLTVRDVMREPSIAGMRPEAEKLSPDGKFVVYAWNADGKEPRNLYIVSTNGGDARILVDAERNYEPRTSAPESKLNYGLIVRDDFVKAREKNLGGVDISPDSKRILFSQNSDIYVLDLDENANQAFVQPIGKIWTNYQTAMMRRTDLASKLIQAAQKVAVQENEIFRKVGDARLRLINTIRSSSQSESGDQTFEQKQAIIDANNSFASALGRLLILQESYPQLRADELFMKTQDELSGTENRLNVARIDYENLLKNAAVSNTPRRITRTQGFEGGARWLTGDSILYNSGGNYFVLNLKETSLIQVTKEANPAAFVSIFGVEPTKDGKLLAYILSNGSAQKSLFVPNYLDEFVQANSTRRGFTDQKVYAAPTDGSREKPFEINLPKSEGSGYIRSLSWVADNRSLVVDRVDKDLKRRQLYYIHNVGGKDEQTILITEDADEKWIGSLSQIVEPNPKDASQILFASEKDGYNHLYLATLERAAKQPNPTGEIRQENAADAGFTSKVDIKQLTKGNWQVDWAKWIAGDTKIVFSSTENNPAERDFFIYELGSGEKHRAFRGLGVLGPQEGRVTFPPIFQNGMKINPQIDENDPEQVLLYEYSQYNQPTELYAYRIYQRSGETYQPQQLTKTTPESFKQIKWNAPQFIDIPARDGKPIKSKIYTPAGFDKSKKYPMVIFVHGAGYLQNTINGWNNYYREFMFNEMLTQKGYVVLDVDYRGSAGYGRDWRTDVYDFLGGKDYEDELDAIDYAVKNYAVDAKKIGVYGGSYGGFMAEMLAFRTDKITCAAALRPVADWKNYYYSSPIYTAERLGFPDKNVEGYKRSSPISYAEKLDKPLLILHGLVDDNVPAQDSMQLVEKLIRLEKTNYFDEMIYPAESHGFVRPTSWTDEYTRILNFFEKHLKYKI